MGGPADIPLTTPRLQLSFWASSPQAGLPDYRVRSAWPSKGLKDISRKPRERGNMRVQRLRHGQLPSQPRDGGDKARPQAGPTWHCSPSPQAFLRAVRREARTMHASRTQERVRPQLRFPRPCWPPASPVSQVGAGCCVDSAPTCSHESALPVAFHVLQSLGNTPASADSLLPAGSLWDLPHPARSLSLLTPAGRPSHRLTLQEAGRWA